MTDHSSQRGDRPGSVQFSGNMPQRYLVNQERYAARGGLIRLPEDMHGFVTAEINKSDMSRFYSFCLAFDQIVKEGLKGDFAELGVYKGHTASLLATMARRVGSTAYLLDTFTGFSSADLKGIDAGVETGFTDTSMEAVRALVGNQNVQFVPGYFPASAAQIPTGALFSLVHLDCDLYAPMASALAYFYPRLVPGGFLIVHDYSSLHWPGAERAIDEFFATRAEAVIPLPDSSGSVVIRKGRQPQRYDNWYVQRNATLLGPEWASAARGNLSTILGDGWSAPEDWGVWGIDEVHQFFIFLGSPPTQDIELDFDVAALLVGADAIRAVGIFVDGHKLQDWVFTAEMNRSSRSVIVPQGCLPAGDENLPVIPMEIRPATVPSGAELRARGGDHRRLGVSLHRVRRKA